MKMPLFAAVLTLGMGVLAIPSLAIAQPTIEVVDPAALIDGGVGAIVSVEITCDIATRNVSIGVTLVQRDGTTGFGNTASGGLGSGNINCTSSPQTVNVAVTSSGRIFRPRRAFAQANILQCNSAFNSCESGQATDDIRVR